VAEKELSQYPSIGQIGSGTRLAVIDSGRNAQAPANVLGAFVGDQIEASGLPAEVEALKAGQQTSAIYADTLAALQAVVGTYEGQGAFVLNGAGAGQYRWSGAAWQFLRADMLFSKADKAEVAEVAGAVYATVPEYLDMDVDGLNQVARGLRSDGTSTMLAAEVGGLRIARLSDNQASIDGSVLWHGVAEEFALELTGQFEGAFYVEMDGIGIVRFAILADGTQYPPVDAPVQRSFVLSEQITLPNGAQGQNPNGGWTSTGLDIPSTGKWRGCPIIGNDGRVYEGTQGGITATFQCSLVCTSPDFRRILWEVPCNTAAFPGIESIQGVAWDTSDDTIWFADKTNKTIRHVTVAGAKLLDEIVVSHTLNGIAYRPDMDAIYTPDEGTNTLRLVSCANGAVLRTQTGIHPQADQLHYEEDRNRLWATVGSNGEDGRALVYDADTLVLLETYILSGSQAIEGIHYNPTSQVLTTVNDGAFHLASNPALALACKYTFQ